MCVYFLIFLQKIQVYKTNALLQKTTLLSYVRMHRTSYITCTYIFIVNCIAYNKNLYTPMDININKQLHTRIYSRITSGGIAIFNNKRMILDKFGTLPTSRCTTGLWIKILIIRLKIVEINRNSNKSASSTIRTTLIASVFPSSGRTARYRPWRSGFEANE